MAPSAVLPVESHPSVKGKNNVSENTTKNVNKGPLRKTGVLDSSFPFDEITPVIGREYPSLNIVDNILNSPKADELLRDLAITS